MRAMIPRSEQMDETVKEGPTVESKTVDEKPRIATTPNSETSSTLPDDFKMKNVLNEKAPASYNEKESSTTIGGSESHKISEEDKHFVTETPQPEAIVTVEGREPTASERVDTPMEGMKDTGSETQVTEIVGAQTVQGGDNGIPAKSDIPADIASELESLRRELQEASNEKAELQQKLNDRDDELKQCQEQIESLEIEIEKQLEDWGRLADKLVDADTTIKSLMEEAQEVDVLKDKLDEYENLKHELEEANQKLSSLKEKNVEAVVTEVETPEIEKLKEKDTATSVLQIERDCHKREDSGPSTKLDFCSLNTSLALFCEEISLAMSELEEAQKKLC
jgi:hypothetical protein